jgi:hypothetical protein
MFAWLISHQPTVLFSQNKSAINISQQYFSLRTNQHQHQPSANQTGCASADTAHARIKGPFIVRPFTTYLCHAPASAEQIISR